LGHLYRIKKKEKINRFGIGGFLALSHKDTTDEKKEIIEKSKKQKIKYGCKDLDNLKKIYSLCERNKIKLILLNTPIEQNSNEKLSVYYSKYLEFKNNNLPNATLLDYSKVRFDKKDFADKGHLNANGARLFSEMFVKQLHN
jgi:lysophospholipase L1-like esterase